MRDTYQIAGIDAEEICRRLPKPKPSVGIIFTASGHVTKKGDRK
jgi:hypothetical protein